MARPGGLHQGGGVMHHGVDPGPQAGMAALAEAALIDGVGDDAPGGPVLGGVVEGVGIIVEAVQRDDHRARFGRFGAPGLERQAGAVARGKGFAVDGPGTGHGARRLQPGRAGAQRQSRQQDRQRRRPCKGLAGGVRQGGGGHQMALSGG